MSHLKVDRAAGVPTGTASFNYRTRAALLQAAAVRLTELDLEDLAAVAEEAAAGSTGTASPLARAVFAASVEPRLTRTRARYELLLHAARDAELAKGMQKSAAMFMRLSRAAILAMQPGSVRPSAEVLDDQTVAAMAFIEGVMMGFARGDRTIRGPEHIDRLLSDIVAGVAASRQASPR